MDRQFWKMRINYLRISHRKFYFLWEIDFQDYGQNFISNQNF